MTAKTADLVTFTEEILNGKLHFLCSETSDFNIINPPSIIVMLTLLYVTLKNGQTYFKNLAVWNQG